MLRVNLALTLAAFLAGGFALLHAGAYGLTVFLILPFVIGVVVSATFLPTSGKGAAGAGALGVAACSFGFLMLGQEGVICILMALPLMRPMRKTVLQLIEIATGDRS